MNDPWNVEDRESKGQLRFPAWVNSDGTDGSGNSGWRAQWGQASEFDFGCVEFEVLLCIEVEMSSK